MTIHEYGDRNKPHILLIHGMWMFRGMMGGMQKHPAAAAKMYSAADIDSDVMKKLSDSMGRTDKKALACICLSIRKNTATY